MKNLQPEFISNHFGWTTTNKSTLIKKLHFKPVYGMEIILNLNFLMKLSKIHIHNLYLAINK